jgi:hypothetical protein
MAYCVVGCLCNGGNDVKIQRIQTPVTGREVTGDPGEPVVTLAQFYPKFIRSL